MSYPHRFVILNSFQDNTLPSPVILERVQDDEVLVRAKQ
jgi:hypothetical protein